MDIFSHLKRILIGLVLNQLACIQAGSRTFQIPIHKTFLDDLGLTLPSEDDPLNDVSWKEFAEQSAIVITWVMPLIIFIHFIFTGPAPIVVGFYIMRIVVNFYTSNLAS